MDDDEFTSYRNRLTKCVTTVAGDDGKTNTGDALNSIFVEFSGEPRLLFMAGEEIGILIGYDMGTRKVKVDLDAIEKQIAEIEKGMKNAETDSNR